MKRETDTKTTKESEEEFQAIQVIICLVSLNKNKP